MKFQIENNQFPSLEITLDKNEEVKIETGSMVMQTNGIKLEGRVNGGGVFKGFAKTMLGGENFFVTTAKSSIDKQRIILAPKGFGTIYHIQLSDTQWYLEDGVFLASSPGVDYEVKNQRGLGNAVLGGTGGFFILKTSGVGDLFLESFGSIKEIELIEGEEYVVDNNHLIAWEETVSHSIEVGSGVFGFKTGEGLVTRLRGRGKVLIQTRQPEALVQKISGFFPKQR